MFRLLLAVWLISFSGSVGAERAAGLLFQTRQEMLALAAHTDPNVFCGAVVDARTDIVAFPAARSDRMYMYTYGYGIGRAYVLRGGRAQLIWCGKALYTRADAARWASRLPGNAARALAYSFGTKWGRLPVETGGMDVFSSFAGTLTTMTVNAAGKIVCTRTRGDPVAGEFRSAFQFDARDTCP